MDSVPVPKMQATHLSTEENGTTARAGGRIWEPPLWKAHYCLSEEPQRQARGAGGAWPLAMTPMFLSLLEIAGLFHSLLDRFQGEVYKQVRRMGNKGVWNLPFPIPIPWKLEFFKKGKRAYFLRLRFQNIFNWKVDIYIYLNLEHKTLLKLSLCTFIIYISQWHYYESDIWGQKSLSGLLIDAGYGLNLCANQQVGLIKMARLVLVCEYSSQIWERNENGK